MQDTEWRICSTENGLKELYDLCAPVGRCYHRNSCWLLLQALLLPSALGTGIYHPSTLFQASSMHSGFIVWLNINVYNISLPANFLAFSSSFIFFDLVYNRLLFSRADMAKKSNFKLFRGRTLAETCFC